MLTSVLPIPATTAETAPTHLAALSVRVQLGLQETCVKLILMSVLPIPATTAETAPTHLVALSVRVLLGLQETCVNLILMSVLPIPATTAETAPTHLEVLHVTVLLDSLANSVRRMSMNVKKILLVTTMETAATHLAALSVRVQLGLQETCVNLILMSGALFLWEEFLIIPQIFGGLRYFFMEISMYTYMYLHVFAGVEQSFERSSITK